MVQTRTEKTRLKVLDAAREILLEGGMSALNIKELSAKSGVSNGSIFHHFGSKEGVLAEIFRVERGAYIQAMIDPIIAYEGDPCDAIGEGVKASIEYQMTDPKRFYRLVTEFTDNEWMRENAEVWKELAADIQIALLEWAEPHYASGKLPQLPPPALQAMVGGSTERIVSNFLFERMGDPRELADDTAFVLASGLKALRDLQTARA